MAGVFTFSHVVFIFVFIVVSPSINYTDYVINNILPLSDSHAGLLRNVTVTVVSNCASLCASWRTRPLAHLCASTARTFPQHCFPSLTVDCCSLAASGPSTARPARFRPVPFWWRSCYCSVASSRTRAQQAFGSA